MLRNALSKGLPTRVRVWGHWTWEFRVSASHRQTTDELSYRETKRLLATQRFFPWKHPIRATPQVRAPSRHYTVLWGKRTPQQELRFFGPKEGRQGHPHPYRPFPRATLGRERRIWSRVAAEIHRVRDVHCTKGHLLSAGGRNLFKNHSANDFVKNKCLNQRVSPSAICLDPWGSSDIYQVPIISPHFKSLN